MYKMEKSFAIIHYFMFQIKMSYENNGLGFPPGNGHGRDDPAEGGGGPDVGGRLLAGLAHGRDAPVQGGGGREHGGRQEDN